MTTREWCDRCDAATEFEPHHTMPYTVICQWCGHHRIERTRSSGGTNVPPAVQISGRSPSRRRESDSGPSPSRLKKGHGGDSR